MGFFDSLRRILGREHAASIAPHPVGAAGDDDVALAAAEPFHGGEFDKKNWYRKLKTVLSELPDSKDRWPDLVAEAHALGFEPAMIATAFRAEFALLVRKVVSDRVITEQEHRKLDLARDLLGIPDQEAESMLHNVVSEAETFFGGAVEGA